MVHRDPETGQFVEGHEMKADGGMPPGVMDQAYRGAGCYTDVETVYWNFEAIYAEADQDIFSDELLVDFSDLLDRREEMADLLFLDVALHLGENGDASLASNPQAAEAAAVVHSNSDGQNSPIDINLADFQANATNDFIDRDDGADSISRVLKSYVAGNFEQFDATVGGSGGAGGSDSVDEDRIYGWQLTDPSFEERDELTCLIDYESTGQISNTAQLTGRATFGTYELEEPAVRSC